MKLPIGFKTIGLEFYPYQLESFIHCVTQDTAGLLLDMGLGKSFVAISVARFRIQRNNVQKVLVVAPASIMYNWKKEIERLSEYKAIVVQGGRKEKLLKFSKSKETFLIINYEGLSPILKELRIIAPGKGKNLLVDINAKNVLKQLNINMIIFDESARYIKNPNTTRTICADLLAEHAKYKLILTGTPIANRPLDIWSQFKVLDGGETFGRNFYAWRANFFYKFPDTAWGQFFIKKQKIGELHDAIYRKCIRKTKEEVFDDLPDQVFDSISIEPSHKLVEEYLSVKNQIISEIETIEGTTQLIVPVILTKLLRLQQLTAGFSIYNGKEVELVERPKLDSCIDEVLSIIDQGDSVVIWCRFLKSIDMISKQLDFYDIKHVAMSGADNKKEKFEKWRGFQTSKETNVFIGQVESGGIGIELFKEDSTPDKSQYTIFYENTFSLDVREQAKSRVHRIGQKAKCMYIDLVVENTIDGFILNSLMRKKSVADSIIESKDKKEFFKGV